VAIVDPGDNSGRLFIVEQPGVIRIYQAGRLLSEPFLDIRQQVGSRGNEQGLLGLAFHPAYAQNGLFYVNYTDLNGDTVVARFAVSSQDADRADAGSEQQLLFVRQPYPNHNGGSVVFGPDGYLYLGLGDGGSGGDPQGSGQSLDTPLGKILRIDVDSGSPYAIPAGNPFSAPQAPEIWAYGLRNPWRFSFDRLTGDLYVADVGQNQWEEVNYLPAGSPPGANFGWNYREGLHPYEGTPPGSSVLIDPVAEYDHAQGCSVTGGYVYRGEELPAWQGVYLYGDFCSGIIWGLVRDASGAWQKQVLFETGRNISSFGEDAAGELYLTDLNGAIYRLKARP
jgi:glucose/arabinose dehydrogenase